MATLSITIPDEVAPRVFDALAARYAYDPASGLTKAQFVRDLLKSWMRDEVRDHEAAEAAAAARNAVQPVTL
jgi:hypothetical protein